MRTIILAGALLLSTFPLVAASSPIGNPTNATYCSSATAPYGTCPWMLCWHPHYNQWGEATWCDIGLLWPCQYCVPLSADLKASAPVVPVEVSSTLLP